MKSRLLVGAGAWLLGAVAATGGSMIAVDQIAHGLLGPQTGQLTEAATSAGPDAVADPPSFSATAGRAPAASGTPSAARGSATGLATPSPGQTSAGTLLQSADGSVMAACQGGDAYMLYWSPDQGFQADEVYRGPAAIASVTFRGPTGGVVMRVSCSNGSPVARLYQPSADDDSGYGD